MDCHLTQQPIPLKNVHAGLSVCESLSQFLLKALEKQPEKRHATIDEFGQDLVEAIKKDQVSLRSLKHRREILDSGVRGLSADDQAALAMAMKTGKPPASPAVTPTDGIKSGNQENKQSIALGSAVQKALGQMNTTGEQPRESASEPPKDAEADNKYAFLNCPHCGDQVARDLAFCLSCGRSLAATDNFSKMRAAQGIFTLPKSQEQGQLPTFSAKARGGAADAGLPRHILTALIASIVFVSIMVLVFTGGLSNLGRLAQHVIDMVDGGGSNEETWQQSRPEPAQEAPKPQETSPPNSN